MNPNTSGRSSAWLERLLWEQEVARSNRVAPTNKNTGFQSFSAGALFSFYGHIVAANARFITSAAFEMYWTWPRISVSAVSCSETHASMRGGMPVRKKGSGVFFWYALQPPRRSTPLRKPLTCRKRLPPPFSSPLFLRQGVRYRRFRPRLGLPTTDAQNGPPWATKTHLHRSQRARDPQAVHGHNKGRRVLVPPRRRRRIEECSQTRWTKESHDS